jgi:hypothetical protein
MHYILVSQVALASHVVVTPAPFDHDHVREVGRHVNRDVRGVDEGVAVVDHTRSWGGACAIPLDGAALESLRGLSAAHDTVWVADPSGRSIWRFDEELGVLGKAWVRPPSADGASATLVVAGDRVPAKVRHRLADTVREGALGDPLFAAHLRNAFPTCVSELPEPWMDRLLEHERPGEPLYVALHPEPGVLVVWRVDTQARRLIKIQVERT